MNPSFVLDTPIEGGGWRAHPPGDPTTTWSLWEGPAPPAPPTHPALPAVVGEVALDGLPAWIEERPPGPLLAELEPLGALEAARLLADLASGLAALHGCGLVHGGVSPRRAVLGPGGQGAWLGRGLAGGSPRQDVEAFERLARTLWPPGAGALPRPAAGTGAAGWQDALEGWIGDRSSAAREALARRLAPAGGLPVEPLPPPEADIDEVAVDVGPEPGGEPTSSASSVTITATRGPDLPDDRAARHTRLLARLVGPPAHPPASDRFEGREQAAATAIRALVADEPLDALPLAEGILAAPLDPPLPDPSTGLWMPPDDVPPATIRRLALALALAALFLAGLLTLAPWR